MQTTRTPKQGSHSDKPQEASPPHRPERKSPGHEGQGDGHHADTPRRPGEDKPHEDRKPANRR